MSGDNSSDLAAPLLALAACFGLTGGDLQRTEEPDGVAYYTDEFSWDANCSLDIDIVSDAVTAYGDAIACRVLAGEAVIFDLRDGLTADDVASFSASAAQSRVLTLDLRLDKARLIARHTAAYPNCRYLLFLFPEAFRRAAARDLGSLEETFWGDSIRTKVIVLLRGVEVSLDGSYLAITTAGEPAAWSTACPPTPPDFDRTAVMCSERRNHVAWQQEWTRHLTPLHMRLAGTVGESARSIVAPLWTHAANLFLLYTADRTIIPTGGAWTATYASAQQQAAVPLGSPDTDDLGDAVAHVAALAGLADWIYNPEWVPDRLTLAQIALVQTLRGLEPSERYTALVRSGAALQESIAWQWKSFVEGKAETYGTYLQKLEDDLSTTVQSVADQVNAITKTLSDAMVAAIVALLGSFVASLFKDTFNRRIFSLGLLIYALYLLGIPLAYGMRYQWLRFREVLGGFAVKKERLLRYLPQAQVDRTVGTRLAESESRFKHWFWTAVGIYVTVAILAIIGAFLVPDVLQVRSGDASGNDQSATPMPAPAGTMTETSPLPSSSP